jgi:hypothetical protein
MANYRKSVKVPVKPDWAPVRKGPIYCSPACGAGCTHDAFELARLRSQILVRALVEAGYGNRWEGRVWENLGWHYSARVPGQTELEVHVRGDRSDPLGPCWVSFMPKGCPQITAEADTPMRALALVGDKVRAIYDSYTRALKTVNQFADGRRKRR